MYRWHVVVKKAGHAVNWQKFYVTFGAEIEVCKYKTNFLLAPIEPVSCGGTEQIKAKAGLAMAKWLGVCCC